jgi:tetratricopeptide (TPR) repeat protein
VAFDDLMDGVDLQSLDLDAVTVNQPRGPFILPNGRTCDWSQDTDTVRIFLTVGASFRGRDLNVQIKSQRLDVVVREPMGTILLAGALGGRCDPSESEWELESGELMIVLHKAQQREWAIPIQDEATGSVNALSDSARKIARASCAPAPAAHSASSAPAVAARQPPEASSSPTARAPAAAAPPARVNSAVQASSRLGDKYRAWDRFDDIGALAGLENAGKSAEEPGFTLRSNKGVASMQCTEYVKDREEVELDEDLAQSRTSLQQSINLRLTEAAELKTRGNTLLHAGETAEALATYLEAESSLEAAENAKVILSGRLVNALSALLRDLRSNAAAAAIKLDEWDEAIRATTAVLKEEPQHIKALYRRATALISRRNGSSSDDIERARTDLVGLLKVQPQNAAARKLLETLPV